ncbi:hypothetical protein CAPTEDRAFT_188871 [Capitella teleta]|uniref:Uncharacterized protein n=1 Tax=Capitella teleta TaxID=283909 RepID=R7T678_CAPTE|nr:hypothetical protein CAPTEDRAFT_188871 [Capitella teleta]|eukprot:ELT88753.1 hypothetical protein CAPTEDRAFT_188871 [Capitella teleta]
MNLRKESEKRLLVVLLCLILVVAWFKNGSEVKSEVESSEKVEDQKTTESGLESEFRSEQYGLDPVDPANFTVKSRPKIPCMGDCITVQGLLKDWPEAKPKGAYYVLIPSMKRMKFVLRIFRQIRSNLLGLYPVIVLCMTSTCPKSFPRDSANGTDRLFYQRVQQEAPSFLRRPIPRNTSCNKFEQMYHREMNRFQSLRIYDEPILSQFEYLLRLNDVSEIPRPVSFDIFKFTKTHNITYGYRGIEFEKKVCTRGLWEASRDYLLKNDIDPQFFSQWPPRRSFYNNFEISKSSLWLSQEYKALLTYFDRLGGIFYHRWGDGAMRTIAVSMFVPRSQVHHFGNVPYRHGEYLPEVSPGFDKVEGSDYVEDFLDPNLDVE